MISADKTSPVRRHKTPGPARLFARFLRRSDGAAAVEFALVALPFLYLIFVIFETAGIIFTDLALQNGVTETARLIRTGQVQTEGISSSKFKTLLCGNIVAYIDCTKIRVDVTKSSKLPLSGPNMMTVTDATAQAFQPGGPTDWILVQARYDWQIATPGFTGLANMGTGSTVRRIVGAAMFRNEPYTGG